MKNASFCTLCELFRWIGAGTGIFLAFLIPNDPSRQLDLLCVWVVVPIAGLTGIESVFFSSAAAKQSGYEKGSAYQRQSGLSNLALALTEILSKVVYGFPERTLFSKLTYATSSAVFISSPSLNRTPLITFSIS